MRNVIQNAIKNNIKYTTILQLYNSPGYSIKFEVGNWLEENNRLYEQGAIRPLNLGGSGGMQKTSKVIGIKSCFEHMFSVFSLCVLPSGKHKAWYMSLCIQGVAKNWGHKICSRSLSKSCD